MNSRPALANEAHPPSKATMRRFLIVALAVPVLLCILPFWVVRLPVYRKITNNFNFPSLDFGFKTVGQNADIVIYGDSAATHGFNPRQMEAALHLHVLDIPSNSSLLSVTGDLPLIRYLKADKPPQLIVLYFAAWDLNFSHEDYDAHPPYDGMEVLMRNGTSTEILALAKRHPLSVAEFPLMFYSLNTSTMLSSRATFDAQAQQVAATNGYSDFPGHAHYPSDCKIPASLIDKIQFDSVRDMARKFETPQTKVLIYVAPVPDCVNAQTVVDQPYQRLPAALPKILPAADFGPDQFYTHLYPAGVPASTENLIEAVRPLLANAPR